MAVTAHVPVEVFTLIVSVAFIVAAYAIIRYDSEYYTHLIASFVSSLLFVFSSYFCFGGIYIHGDSVETAWASDGLGYVFIVIAVIMTVYMFMRIYDLYKEHISGGWMRQ